MKSTSSVAYIVGNGPSTTAERLDKLIGKDTFAMNRIAMIFDQTDWRPTYYIGTTSALWDKRHAEDVLRGLHSAQEAYCWDKWHEYLHNVDEINATFCPCSEIHHVDHTDVTDEIWSDDPTQRLSKFGVTAFPAMQVAAYLGYKTICLIGCDGGYSEPMDGVDTSHFNAGYRVFNVEPDYDYNELNNALHTVHGIAQRNCDRLGIKIYNLSPISSITAHETMRFKDAL